MRLCLVEDNAAADLEPLTLTRPVFELRLGRPPSAARSPAPSASGRGRRGAASVVRNYLAALQQARDPHTAVNDANWLARGPVTVVNSRWVPPERFTPPEDGQPWVGTCDGQPACARVGPDRVARLERGRGGRLVRGGRGRGRPDRRPGRRVDRPAVGPRGQE